MKLKKMLEQLVEFFDADLHNQRKELQSIQKVLRKLKQKERDLKAELEAGIEDADQAAELQDKLSVIYAQRTKGVDLVKSIKKELKEAKKA